MTTMTDSEALAVLDELSEYLAERADVKDGDYGQPEPNTEMTLHVELRQARAHIAEALRDARRYRALIDSGSYSPGVRNHGGCPWGLRMSGSPFSKADLDAAIDAAMKDKE